MNGASCHTRGPLLSTYKHYIFAIVLFLYIFLYTKPSKPGKVYTDGEGTKQAKGKRDEHSEGTSRQAGTN